MNTSEVQELHRQLRAENLNNNVRRYNVAISLHNSIGRYDILAAPMSVDLHYVSGMDSRVSKRQLATMVLHRNAAPLWRGRGNRAFRRALALCK